MDIRHYIRAIHSALGIKRYIIGSAVLVVSSLYEFIRAWLLKYDLRFLPALPVWEIAIGIILLFFAWWFLQKIVLLEQELEPNLEIVYKKGPPFEITEPMNSTGHCLRFYRVKVQNKSIKNLTNCLVMLEDMKTPDGRVYSNRFVPIGLTTDHQFLQKRRRGVFNLRGKQYKFIVVAYLDETNSNNEIVLMYENENYPDTIPRGSYIITLSAYGGGLPTKKRFALSVDQKGYLQMKPA